MKRSIFSAVVFCSTVFAANEPNLFRNELGLNLGPGNPTGAIGLEYTRAIGEHHALGVGAGESLAGWMQCVGYKYFVWQDRRFNPYVGLSGFHATGLILMSEMTVEGTTFTLEPGYALAPRAGFRYQAGWRMNLYLNAGYGFVVQGGGAKILRQLDDGSKARKFIGSMDLGGPELSMSIMFRFGQSSP